MCCGQDEGKNMLCSSNANHINTVIRHLLVANNIPWYIFSILGGGIALISYFISASKLAIFVFAGIILFLWGLLKYMFSLKEQKIHAPTASEKKQHHIETASHVVRCDDCGIKMHPLFNFCPKCGKKHR